MSTPTSFRLPFTLPEDVHPAVKDGMRLLFQGVLDNTQAITALKGQGIVPTTPVTTVTPLVSGGGGGSSAPSTIGTVNLQPNPPASTAYTTAQSDFGGLIVVQSAPAFAYTLDSGLTVPFYVGIINKGAGTVTMTPTTGQVNNAASVPLTTGQFALVYFDGVNWWAGVPVSAATVNFADGETPAGTIDGVNKVFTLAHAPSPALSLELFNNGMAQHAGGGNDYTLSGLTITFTVAPVIGATLLAWYRY